MNESMNGDNKTYFAFLRVRTWSLSTWFALLEFGRTRNFDTYLTMTTQRALSPHSPRPIALILLEGLVSDINAYPKEHFQKM